MIFISAIIFYKTPWFILGSDSTYIRVEGANHRQEGVPQTMGYEAYLSAIEIFITQ